jgi:predicted transcriptional regulator
MPASMSIIESAMTGIPLPHDLSTSQADLAKTNGQTTSDLGMDAPRDYTEHDRILIAEIELAIKEADQCNFATEEKVAAMRARRWSRNAC